MSDDPDSCPEPLSEARFAPAAKALRVDIVEEAGDWSLVAADDRLAGLVERIAAIIPDVLDLGPNPVEVCLALGDDAHVRALNARFRDQDKPTNVLSFPSAIPHLPVEAEAGGGLAVWSAGDLVIAQETLVAEAAAEGKQPVDHFAHLVVHGLLHLLGYDHGDEAEASEMEGLEVEILARLGIADPYRDMDLTTPSVQEG